jgi:hypothetical protein
MGAAVEAVELGGACLASGLLTVRLLAVHMPVALPVRRMPLLLSAPPLRFPCSMDSRVLPRSGECGSCGGGTYLRTNHDIVLPTDHGRLYTTFLETTCSLRNPFMGECCCVQGEYCGAEGEASYLKHSAAREGGGGGVICSC